MSRLRSHPSHRCLTPRTLHRSNEPQRPHHASATLRRSLRNPLLLSPAATQRSSLASAATRRHLRCVRRGNGLYRNPQSPASRVLARRRTAPAQTGAVIPQQRERVVSAKKLSLDGDWLRRNRCCGTTLQVGAAGLANIDAALEERTIFNRDARCDHIAGQGAFAANIHAIARLAVAANLAQYNNLTRHDVCRDLTIAANSHAVARQINRAFYLAVDVQRFRARQLSLNNKRLADGRLLSCRYCRRRSSSANRSRPRGARFEVRRRRRGTHGFRS